MRVKTGKSGSPAEDWQRAIEELQVEQQSSCWEKFWRWTGIPEKKGWDLMTGLSIPLLIFVGGSLFTFLNNQQQQMIADANRKQDLQISDEKQKDEVLRNYFDNMRALLLDKDKPLRKSKEGDESRSIARTLTLTAFRQVESSSTNTKIGEINERKSLIVHFLYESNLVTRTSASPIINLVSADIRRANLFGAILPSANLFGANLFGANLTESDLVRVNLGGTNLTKAELKRANLSGATLFGAVLVRTSLFGTNLMGANLNKAILLYTDLRNTQNLTRRQLEGSNTPQGSTAPLLCNVALPKELTEKPHSINPNRDCDRIPQKLAEIYSKPFPTLQKAENYVNQAREEKWDQE